MRIEVRPGESLQQALKRHGIELGKTGEFPDGKLTPHDEGALNFAIGSLDGQVVLNFGTPVVWFGMDPAMAKDIAHRLIEHANRITDARDATKIKP